MIYRLLLLAVALSLSAAGTSLAAHPPLAIGSGSAIDARPLTTLAELSGRWALSLYYLNGCGTGTTYGTIDLDASGSGTMQETYHTTGCGTARNSYPFAIEKLHPNGSGKAFLACGRACGFNFRIQVSPDAGVISLVDVFDPSNYLQGMLVKQ